MAADFDACFALLMGHEGGYIDNPADPGGETMWGITKRVAVANGYTWAMKDLPQATAKVIARKEYWTPNGCDELPTPIAFQVFDTAYNGGHALEWLAQITGPGRAVSSMSVWEVVARFNALRLRYFAALRQPVFGDGRMNRIATNLEQGELT